MDKGNGSEIGAYAEWAMSLWFPSSRVPRIDDEVFDHAVMGMGLAGEAIETLEMASLEEPLNLGGLLKEMGDTLYYWCVSCARAHVDPSEAWPSDVRWDFKPARRQDHSMIERSAIRLAIASGKCSEAFKKMVRDGADHARLAAGLGPMARRLVEMSWACGYSLEEVAEGNKSKLAGRVARGTLRGDGNDR